MAKKAAKTPKKKPAKPAKKHQTVHGAVLTVKMEAEPPVANRHKTWDKAVIGRPPIFKSAQELLNAALEYFEFIDANPWYKNEVKGNPPQLVRVPCQRPYTLEGFVTYLGIGTTWWREMKGNESAQRDGFPSVIKYIEDRIYNLKYEGGALGSFNASIIARDLGLVDKVDTTSNGATIGQPVDLGKLDEETLKKLLEATK